MSAEDSYPHVAHWVRDCGWIEIGQDDFSMQVYAKSKLSVYPSNEMTLPGQFSQY
jgi:hypothetical protein